MGGRSLIVRGRMEMRRDRKSGCLGTIIVTVIVIVLAVFAGRFLFSKIVKKEIKKEGLLTELIGSLKDIRKKQNESEITPEQDGLLEQEAGGKFYYEKLSPEEQAVYRVLAAGMKERQDEIKVNYADGNRVNELFQAVLYDFPEIFWCDGKAESVIYQEAEPYVILKPVYLYDEEEMQQKMAEIEAATQECLEGISEDAGDYEKILYVFEYLVNTVDYDLTVDNNQYIYSALVERRSVCAGYARATQYLLERLGVFCTYITGTAQVPQGESGDHAWNLVLCDGDYYYVDTTWGDPVFAGEAESGRKNNICYDYMCCSDEELFKTHTPDPSLELPKCTKMDANYYVVNQMYYTEYDSDSIFDVMSADIREGKEQSVFKFADSETYRQAHEDIFENLIERATQELREQYQLQQSVYWYTDEERLNKIVLYWEYE